MKRNEYKPGELVSPPACFVGRAVQAYGPTGAVHAGIVVSAMYSEDENDLLADVAIVSYADPAPGRLVADARLMIQAGLKLGSDETPKPHTFTFAR